MRPAFARRMWAVSVLLAGCAPAKAPPVPAPKSAPALASASEPRARLVQALRAIPRPEPLLLVLPEGAQKQLQARFAALDGERKLSVHSDDSPLVESLPLLHLISGGASPRALYALATSPAGSQELTGVSGIEPSALAASLDGARLGIVRELARRAALNFLRDRAADVAEAGKGTALVCRLVARAAQAVDRQDLILLARELLASAEPNSENTLEFARELARAGDAAQAARRLAEARADRRHPPLAESIAATEQLIAVARVASAPASASTDVATTLLRARAWLHLGRVSEASALLDRQAAVAKTRLDLAAATAETLMVNPSCPDLPLDVGSAPLCALAFRSSDRVKVARQLLDTAWQSGAGRDDEAIEVYTALAHVIPWMHETASDISRGALSSTESSARVAALLEKLREISAVAPRLSGLTLLLETAHSGPSQRVSGLRSDADADALSARALSLASTDSGRFAQAGVLAVAAALSHQRDITALLDAIPSEHAVSALRVPRAALEVWLAASTGAPERMDAARTELAAIMSEGQGGSLERARLVLSVSEADALLQSSERAYQLLSRVAGQLLNDNIPPDLALRAVLDASGALAHGQRFAQAEKILDGAAAAELPPELDRARDLLDVIKGYKLVLGARSAQVTALSQVRSELASLAARPHGDAAAVWFELWGRELDALQKDSECAKKKLKVCREAVLLRDDARRGRPARLGSQGNLVLKRGALPSGSFDAGFRFTVERGLEPLIVFDPSFLAVGLPRPTNE